MAEIKHLTQKQVDETLNRLWDVEGSLNGLGALFRQITSGPHFDSSELYGLGQLFASLSMELSEIHRILRCGKLEEIGD